MNYSTYFGKLVHEQASDVEVSAYQNISLFFFKMYQYKIFQLKLQYMQDQTIIILIKLNNEMVILNFIKTFLSLGYLPIYSLA